MIYFSIIYYIQLSIFIKYIIHNKHINIYLINMFFGQQFVLILNNIFYGIVWYNEYNIFYDIVWYTEYNIFYDIVWYT